MICLSCTENSIAADLEIIDKNRRFIDLAEIRADFLSRNELEKLHVLPEKAGVPCILTFRWPADGGVNNKIGIKERAAIMSGALEGRWAYMDIEDDADSEEELGLLKTAECAGVRIIKSFHDFNGVPKDLAERMLEISKGDRYIPKAAVMPQNTEDFFRIVEAHRRIEEVRELSAGYSCINGPFISDYILVGMGPVGFPSRIMAGAWGSMLTFCSAGNEKAAPGHITPSELVDVYNYPKLTRDTRVFGIIGNPVMHTKSPALHNAAIRRNELDAVYLPFETTGPEVLLSRASEINLDGLSVTIPFKRTVIALAGTVDPSVKAIGACNTLVNNVGWSGYNTDWVGFLKPLEKEDLSGRRALIVGAGGAARAVVHALVNRGADVTIVNRTAAKAEALAADFGCTGGGPDILRSDVLGNGKSFFIVVQTTSVGMEPNIHDNPVPDFDFSGVEIAYDLVYAPEKTEFLASAEKQGCRSINGMPMLRAQAAEQFRLFTGKAME